MKKLYKDGKLSEFASTDLLRFYEVVDTMFDEYLKNTSATRPPDNQPLKEAILEKPNEQKFLMDMQLKKKMETRCVNKLEIKNRKRIRELNESLELPRREKVLSKKDFQLYERERKNFGSSKQEQSKDLE